MPETVYSVRDARGDVVPVTDPERAERLSRAGYCVTAKTGPSR